MIIMGLEFIERFRVRVMVNEILGLSGELGIVNI